jgi:hypothetical protein
MLRLTKRMWCNNKLSEHTKIQVYRACILSILLYGSECWTLLTRQDTYGAFDASWASSAGKMSSTVVLNRTGIPSMYTILKQRRMWWLRHLVLMEDGQIPRDLLFGALGQGTRPHRNAAAALERFVRGSSRL